MNGDGGHADISDTITINLWAQSTAAEPVTALEAVSRCNHSRGVSGNHETDTLDDSSDEKPPSLQKYFTCRTDDLHIHRLQIYIYHLHI